MVDALLYNMEKYKAAKSCERTDFEVNVVTFYIDGNDGISVSCNRFLPDTSYCKDYWGYDLERVAGIWEENWGYGKANKGWLR